MAVDIIGAMVLGGGGGGLLACSWDGLADFICPSIHPVKLKV